MPIEIRELTIKLTLEDSDNGQDGAQLGRRELANLKQSIIDEAVEQIMNQSRSKKER